MIVGFPKTLREIDSEFFVSSSVFSRSSMVDQLTVIIQTLCKV